MIKRTALIIENGLFQSLAFRLAKDYERVLYWRPWVGSFSHPNDFFAGTGYDQFERIEAYEPYFDDDSITWVFPDVHYPDLQQWLRKQGRQVWGAGHGEDLEMLRGETKELMEEIGLPVKPWWSIIGMDALREHLQDHENVFVKLSKLRGLTETFGSKNYELIKPKLDEVQSLLGGRAEEQEFIVEEGVDTAVEVGYDGYCIDGQFPALAQVGVEIKDCCYFGTIKPYAALPKQVREVNAKLSEPMKDYGYRGFFSTEIRVGKDSKPYLIDNTCRMASPAGESYLVAFKNIADIIEGGSQGKLVQITPAGTFVAQVILSSAFAEAHWLPISIPEKIRDNVHLYHSARIGKQEYVIPTDTDMKEVGSVTAVADTADKAIGLCCDYVCQIEAYQLNDHHDALMDARKQLEKA